MKNIVKELNNLISQGIKKHHLPVVMGNAIRIGPVIIRQRKDKSFLLFDCIEDKTIGQRFSKHGAIATAKLYNENKCINLVENLDKAVQKHSTDAKFYQHTIDKTENALKKDVLDVRLDISLDELRLVTKRLEQIIYN